MLLMPDLRNALASLRSTVSRAEPRVAAAVTRVAAAVAVLGWTLFGLNLARVHYGMGDADSAVFTAVVAAAPVIAAGVYVYGASSTDLPVVDVGSSAPSN